MPESLPAERTLHAALLDDPLRPVTEAELAALQDPDAVDNYRIVLDWRARLLAETTLEAAYLALFRSEVTLPPVFINQLAQTILRGMLDGSGGAGHAARPRRRTVFPAAESVAAQWRAAAGRCRNGAPA